MGTHQLIYIRTDGNQTIASGHLTRCLSIALACRQLGLTVHFLVSDSESFSLLKSIWSEWKAAAGEMEELTGFEFAVSQLQTASYNQLEQELPEVTAILSSHVSDTPVFLLDSYYVTEAYLSAIKPFAKIAYLDDLRLFDYPVDLLVNYDVIPDSELASYRAFYKNAGLLLLGAAYSPLRRQFQGRQISIKSQVKNILITTGGSDSYHFCLAFIRQLEHLNLSESFASSDIAFHIVIGKLNTDKDTLYSYAAALPPLRLHENVNDMAALMLDCDLAVSAAGTTLYELCALGVPSISFTIADNQLSAAKAFAMAGAISCAGDLRENPRGTLENIFQFLKSFSSDDSVGKRKSAQKAMRGLVDGSGALRIADALKKL